MNVLFVIRSMECGGAERQLALLANGLASRHHTVTLATFYKGGVREADLSPGVRLVDLDKRSRWDMVGTFRRLRELIRDTRPDVIHGYLTAGNIAATSSRLTSSRAKVLWALRDSNMDMRRYGYMTRAASKLASLLAFTTDGIIANSQAGVDHAVRIGYPADRLVHVANGIDIDRFCPDPAAGATMRASLDVRRDEPLIGLVGRLDPMKDHECFLRAAEFLTRLVPQARFVCVGHGPVQRRNALQELAASMGVAEATTWLPACSDMKALYSALDVFCLSSRYGEGFPNVLGEAMACARPCVTTDVGDASLVAGDAATVVPPDNPRMLAAAIQTSLTLKSVPAARQRIIEHFSVSRMIDTTEALLLAFSRQTGPLRSKAHFA